VPNIANVAKNHSLPKSLLIFFGNIFHDSSAIFWNTRCQQPMDKTIHFPLFIKWMPDMSRLSYSAI